MTISVWTNPIAIFILIGARTTEQSQVKHELLFCARVLFGNIRRIILFKNLGYRNAYLKGQVHDMGHVTNDMWIMVKCLHIYIYLIQNSQAMVKKGVKSKLAAKKWL